MEKLKTMQLIMTCERRIPTPLNGSVICISHALIGYDFSQCPPGFWTAVAVSKSRSLRELGCDN
jgi:hypothetical protein